VITAGPGNTGEFQRTILVVGHDRQSAGVIGQLLAGLGYQTVHAPTGDAALEWLRTSSPALMLIDYRLIDMGAVTLIETMASEQRLPPFIVSSSRGSAANAVAMMKLGALDYLPGGSAFLDLLGPSVERSLLQVAQQQSLRRAEQALRLSEDRYRRLVEQSPDPMFVNRDGKFVFANDAALKLFQARTKAELLGRDVMAFIHPDFHGVVLARVRQNLVHDLPTPLLEEKIFRLDGQVVDVEVTGTPCLYEGVPSVQVTMRDITDRRRVQEQARQHQSQLAHVMRLNTMGKLVSELAHEINQPLYAIANYASACTETLEAANSKYPPLLHQWLTHIGEQAARAGEIVRRLSGFVRKDDALRTSETLSEIIADIVTLVEIDARTRGARVVLNLDECGGRVLVDRLQIEQVLVNMVLNAIDSMHLVPRPSREVVVSCSTTDDQFEVKVRDAGEGVGQDQLPKLFEPFYTTKANGMGMGLAISRSIVESHGGRIWASRNPDCGMTFHFSLPRATDESGGR